jgi:hypothetical protein
MDDWSLLPSRNAVSEPAPNPQSPMTTTTPPLPDSPARVKRPQPAPITPRPQHTALDPNELAWHPGNQSGAKPQNPDQSRRSMPHNNQSATPKVKDLEPRLDITRPFMDDTGGLNAAALSLPGATAIAAPSALLRPRPETEELLELRGQPLRTIWLATTASGRVGDPPGPTTR